MVEHVRMVSALVPMIMIPIIVAIPNQVTLSIYISVFFYLVNIRFLRCVISKCSYWFLFSSNDNKSFHYNNNYYNNKSYNNNYHDYDHNYTDDHYDYIDNNNNSRYRIAHELFEYSYFFQFPYVF